MVRIVPGKMAGGFSLVFLGLGEGGVVMAGIDGVEGVRLLGRRGRG